MYRSRSELSCYICRFSAKLFYLASLVHEITNFNERKVILFCDWPSISYLVEVIMMALGFNVLSIRAKHHASERDAIQDSLSKQGNSLKSKGNSFNFYSETQSHTTV